MPLTNQTENTKTNYIFAEKRQLTHDTRKNSHFLRKFTSFSSKFVGVVL